MSDLIRYHLGCGSCYLDGYLNVDFPQDAHPLNVVHGDLYTDILRMHYAPASEIRSRHFFEHFGYVDSLVLLYKWTLALVKGGTLIIDLPDLEALAKAVVYASSNNKIEAAFRSTRYLYGSHEAPWAYHINGWTSDMLSYALGLFGYILVSKKAYGDPCDPQPNCGVECIATLFRKIHPEELKSVAFHILGKYRNGESTFENSLLAQWMTQFIDRINS